MDSTNKSRVWKVLYWNIRGLNAEKKWNAVRSKINETQCDIICLQETKREHIDSEFLKQFCPARIDTFEFLPSIGASGGTLTTWELNIFWRHNLL